MNKLKSLVILFTGLLFILQTGAVAQSDYEIVQNFKNRAQNIEIAIGSASSVSDINALRSRINSLESEYKKHKDLLDNSLYPEDYNSILSNLRSMLRVRSNDITKIEELEGEVERLTKVVDTLSGENKKLFAQIKTLTEDKIDSLENLVSRLRANIWKQDQLMKEIVDSMFVEFEKQPANMDAAENKQLIKKVESNNVVDNIRNTVADNIQFVEYGSFDAENLEKLNEQYSDMKDRWDKIGPKLAELYVSRSKRQKQIDEIDTMFVIWEDRINTKIWDKVDELFIQHTINLEEFNSGKEFTASAVSFIDDEIQSVETKSEEMLQDTYDRFVNKVWYKDFSEQWLPVLKENEMISEAQVSTVESKIKDWKDALEKEEGLPRWLYYALGGLLILLVVIIIIVSRKGNSKKGNPEKKKSAETESDKKDDKGSDRSENKKDNN